MSCEQQQEDVLVWSQGKPAPDMWQKHDEPHTSVLTHLFCCRCLPAEPVDLEDSTQHLGVHASRKNPVDWWSAMMRLWRQTGKTFRWDKGGWFWNMSKNWWRKRGRTNVEVKKTNIQVVFDNGNLNCSTLELAALPDRENQNDTPSRTESGIQFLLIHRQRRPNTLNITEKSLKQFLKSTKGHFCLNKIV